MLICRLQIGNKHHKNAFCSEYPYYFEKEPLNNVSSLVVFTLQNHPAQCIWCPEILKCVKIETKQKVCLWKALLGLTLTYRDTPSQLTADVMDQCFKQYWQIITWYTEVMLLTLPSSYILIQTRVVSVTLPFKI